MNGTDKVNKIVTGTSENWWAIELSNISTTVRKSLKERRTVGKKNER